MRSLQIYLIVKKHTIVVIAVPRSSSMMGVIVLTVADVMMDAMVPICRRDVGLHGKESSDDLKQGK